MGELIAFLLFQSCRGRLGVLEYSEIACGFIVLGMWFLIIMIPLALFLTFMWIREGDAGEQSASTDIERGQQ